MATDSPLRVGVVGGLGLMASPMAYRWQAAGPARALRVHDRGRKDERRDRCRTAWRDHGATLVPALEDVVGDGDLDGVFVCCGKNGDDAPVVGRLTQLLSSRASGYRPPFICHLSTVSASFARVATGFCSEHGVRYANYPLTGGPQGAQQGTMLILAGGNPDLFAELRPSLAYLGQPRHFGAAAAAGAEVKLMGHLMVFNGLVGICSAVATHAACLQQDQIGGTEQCDFFDFLNAGAGGTRQWDLVAKRGLQGCWDEPFLARYAAVDALYAAQLCLERGISRLAIQPILSLVLAFSYVLNERGLELATQAILPEMLGANIKALDAFIKRHIDPNNPGEGIQRCINSLPTEVRQTVALDVQPATFLT